MQIANITNKALAAGSNRSASIVCAAAAALHRSARRSIAGAQIATANSTAACTRKSTASDKHTRRSA
jgi:hypothetical protein